MNINQRIISLLQASGKRQKEFAQKIGTSDRNISAWKERGADPPAKLIAPIADYFGVSVEWLLTGEDNRQPPNPAPAAAVTTATAAAAAHGNGAGRAMADDEQELLRIYGALDVRRRHKLLSTAFTLEEDKAACSNSTVRKPTEVTDE